MSNEIIFATVYAIGWLCGAIHIYAKDDLGIPGEGIFALAIGVFWPLILIDWLFRASVGNGLEAWRIMRERNK